MFIVKILGMILLAVYLIFSGLTVVGFSFPDMAMTLLGLVGISSGVLILISIATVASKEKR